MSPDMAQSLRTVPSLANPSGMQAARWTASRRRSVGAIFCGEADDQARLLEGRRGSAMPVDCNGDAQRAGSRQPFRGSFFPSIHEAAAEALPQFIDMRPFHGL